MNLGRRQFILSLLAAGGAAAGGKLMSGGTVRKAWAAGESKILNLIYSWSGHTRYIISLIQQKIGGDLTDLVLAKPYSSDYSTCTEEAKRDQNSQARPELVTKIADFDQYGTIILGYPNWWGTIPMPIATVLSSYNFAGKTILPLCSHGGSRLGRSLDDIKKLAPQARILEGLAVYTTGGSSLPEDLEAWLKKNGLAA